MNSLTISTDKSMLDLVYIHQFLSDSYWARGRTKEMVENSIEHSTCFGIYLGQVQFGFARIITDRVVFAYLMDVFIDKKQRGKGYGQSLLAHILNHPDFSNVQSWYLKTGDAHLLYKKAGFRSINNPEVWMEYKPL